MWGDAGLWTILCTRVAITLVAGEICLRYAAWWITLKKIGGTFIAGPAILGIAIAAFSICGREMQFMAIRSSPAHAAFRDLTTGSGLYEFFQLMLFGSACFFIYPIMSIHYKTETDVAISEMIVRVLLITMSLVGGWETSIFFYGQDGGFSKWMLLLIATVLTISISAIRYKQRWEPAIVEVLVCLYLTVASFIGGWECSVIYHALLM